MLSVSEAEAIIFNLLQPLDNQFNTEIVDLLSAQGRILAVPITSELDFPHWDNSAMDGYAVRYEDVKGCDRDNPAILDVIEEIPAGYQQISRLQPGQAARIFTGAVIPTGADTVVMQEVTQRQNNRVVIQVAPKAQEFVRKRGSYSQAGDELLPAGVMVKAPEMGILAAAQCNQVCVFRKPKVAIFSTGNELVTADKALNSGQIVDSNRYALMALVRQLGAEAIVLGIVPDEPEALKEVIETALISADIIISSGGVSVGDYDYVEQIIQSLSGEIHIRSVGMKPGKPLTVATLENEDSDLRVSNSEEETQYLKSRRKLYFGLPGNPVSALVTFWRFVQPAIAKFSGLASGWKPIFIKVKAKQELRSSGDRECYIWGRLNVVDGVYEFALGAGSKVSGNLINLAQTNAIAVLPAGQNLIPAAGDVSVLLVGCHL
ncbi:molybdopterin molybdotransferase MoeA [Brunnivagina elsteri]|uniref:Molybdopterin molybdenumtransferase n=1 Tax=Brunnivagina elsteri CCALA 953 TaxID=987040 RepID=A0A2A2TM31_9CYAN|nr:gephyrin-like molybdotransferase Glp [Calothrix elsteri]PAX59459.1 molybdopterin molybdenumtransferase [Calothrix elsteri CCALA 953]